MSTKDRAIPSEIVDTDPSPRGFSIADLKPDPLNPRKMSQRAAKALAKSLAQFGPLEIVYDEGAGMLVSGHQRVAALGLAGATEVVRVDDETGYIVHPKTGERFAVRFVRWDATKRRLANLVANNPHIQGEFTEDALGQLQDLAGIEAAAELELEALEADLAAEQEADTGESSIPEGDGDQSAGIHSDWCVLITCRDEAEQRELLARLTEEGRTCRALI